jgi:hypothetical protein
MERKKFKPGYWGEGMLKQPYDVIQRKKRSRWYVLKWGIDEIS